MLPSLVDHPALACLPETPTRGDIEAFGAYLLALEDQHGVVDMQTTHHCNRELYGRGVLVKAETFLVGLPHKRPGFAICVGDITVWTEHRGRERFTGAHILNTQPGGMRVGFAHADTNWFTVHQNPTGEANLHAIEEELVERAHLLMTRRVALGLPA